MHIRITRKLFPTSSSALIAAFLMAFIFVASSTAQEKEVNKIEVKDGKVFVNGEMVKELEDADRPLLLLGENSEEGHAMSFFSSDDNPAGNAFVFGKSDGNGKTFELFGDHKDMKFFSLDGNTEHTGEHLAKMHRFGGDPVVFSGADNFRWGSVGSNNLLYSSRSDSDEIRKLEMESNRLAVSYRTSTESEKEGLADDLRRILEKIFDLKEEAMTKRLTKMNTELDKLSTRVQDRRSSKDEIVTRRYQELIGEKDSLAW